MFNQKIISNYVYIFVPCVMRVWFNWIKFCATDTKTCRFKSYYSQSYGKDTNGVIWHIPYGIAMRG